tara:strand:+ start:5091 stop:6161 length:1071 start_codon:yes stop_codon:yes gene_type:complete
LPYLEVKSSGLFASVQDNGRKGMKSIGVSCGGALDDQSFSMSNYILENSKNDASIEIIGGGFEAIFSEPTFFCITGALGKNYLDKKLILNNTPYYASYGSKINIGILEAGWICYLGIMGGVQSKKYFGSRSVYINSEIFGEKIDKYTKINYIEKKYSPKPKIYKIKNKYSNISTSNEVTSIRVLESTEYNKFTDKSKKLFFSSIFTISDQYNRQGMRLNGPEIHTKKDKHDIISNYVNKGSIQVPGDKMPIVLLSDSQTTGGYPKIANVISVDFTKLVQLRPGSKIRFFLIDITEAQNIYRKNIKYIEHSIYEKKLEKISLKVNGSDISFGYLFGDNANLIDIDGRLLPLDFIKEL